MKQLARVTVSNTIVNVSGITLNYSEIILSQGQEFQLVGKVIPEGATNTAVFWSSDMPGVVSVDTSGLVTAKNLGSAVITVVTEDGNLTASCKVMVSKTGDVFSDVSENWAKDEVLEMVDLGLISGYSDSTFRPSSTITRAEFLSILIRLLEKTQDIEIQSGHTFDDTGSHWAKDYISTAVALGITSGYGNGNFGPNDNITREQIALMLSIAAGYDGSATEVSFSDSDQISGWALDAVSFTSSEGIFSGYGDGSFGPKKNATRAEACALLLRFYKKISVE